MNILNIVVVAEDLAQNRSNKSIYFHHSTKLRIKDIKELDGGNLLITTGRVFQNFSILSDDWQEIIFQLEYDVHHEEAQELLNNLGYADFSHVSVFDFMSIKAKGRKLYGFTVSKALKIKCTTRRKLDMSNYDDVNSIWKLYYAKVSKYEHMKSDIKDFTSYVDLEQEDYERNLREATKYHELANKLLAEMTSDDSSGSSEELETILTTLPTAFFA